MALRVSTRVTLREVAFAFVIRMNARHTVVAFVIPVHQHRTNRQNLDSK